jgi:transposase
VQVVRSPPLAQRQPATLAKRVAAAAEEWRALPPTLGRGKRQLRDADTVQAAMARVLAQHEVAGVLTVPWERHETTVTRYVGRGRGGPGRSPRTQVQVRYALTGVQRNEEAMAVRRHRLGRRVQVTHAPVDRRPLPQAVRHPRGGWALERDCHRVKDLPLGRSPVLVWKSEQIKGLTRLLTLARRLLTLLEMQVRRRLAQTQEAIAGLYEGSPTRTTEQPTGTRILDACARAQITLTHVRMEEYLLVSYPPPAMAAGITDHCWSVHELLSYHVPPPRWTPPTQRGRPSRVFQRLVERWCS